jgi:DNA-binding transcriptional regulator GbsR (MarR family)
VNERNTFIERMGLAAESDGLSRIAGRVFAALLLESDPLSLDALAEQLGVSKASISTEARRLLDRGVAERVTKPGDRRDYYVLATDFFAQIVRFRLGRWSAFHRLVTEMQDSAADEPRAVRERFAYLDEFHGFILARIEEALDEWRDRAERPAAQVRERSRSGRPRSTPKHGGKRQLSRERLG